MPERYQIVVIQPQRDVEDKLWRYIIEWLNHSFITCSKNLARNRFMVEYAWTMCWIAPPVSLECVLEDPVAVPSCPAINWPVPNPTPPPEVPEDRSEKLEKLYSTFKYNKMIWEGEIFLF